MVSTHRTGPVISTSARQQGGATQPGEELPRAATNSVAVRNSAVEYGEGMSSKRNS